MRSKCRTNRGFVPQFKALTPPFVCWSAVFYRVFQDPLTRVFGQLSATDRSQLRPLTMDGNAPERINTHSTDPAGLS